MKTFLRSIFLMVVGVVAVKGQVIPYGPTEVQQLSPCNSVIKLTENNLQSTTIYQLDALKQPPQMISDIESGLDSQFNSTSCAFIFEGPQNATLTFQLIGVTILRESPFPNDTAPCLTLPLKSSIQLYDFTSDGSLSLIAIMCQNETRSEPISTTSNIGVLTSTISGYFALSVQKVYAAQTPSPSLPQQTLPYIRKK